VNKNSYRSRGNRDCGAILSRAYRSAAARGVIVVVFVALGKEAVSLISMRPASKNERKLYAEY